ncbi:class I poly(R)-hydroxyalkanoic acid synthase [Aliikangiella maris]|uniref:Class I poly(R)-hydroxyalkanoic acid synthase n=2 Tax=Aliikangiella maris TaxID=3162458 RepID=A0ABV3MS63_9GAMM
MDTVNNHDEKVTNAFESNMEWMNSFYQLANQWTNLVIENAKSSPILGEGPMQAICEDYLNAIQPILKAPLEQPEQVLKQQAALWEKHSQLSQNIYLKLTGINPEPLPVAQPEPGDKRFATEQWTENPLFDYIKQSYLINSAFYIDFINSLQEIDDITKEKLLFFARQWISAISPSNFLLTNPEALIKTLQTGGANLLSGLDQLQNDIKQSIDTLNISITDNSAFKIGENLAATQGKVIFQNRLIQLIHYSPVGEKVYQQPMLIVPPWINKYYVLDLREKNSFARWLVNQGYDTFMISWVNPDESYKDVGFDDYIQEAIIEALNQIEKITEQSKIHCIGYCLGGTLLGAATAYLQQSGDNRIQSTTYLATLLDFTYKGEIGIFINESILNAIEKTMLARGVFDGRAMAVSFNLLRENELYWNYFVNNYLKGEKPSPFDLLYWSSDSTNIPARLHQFVLRKLYFENALVHPGEVVIQGKGLDLSKINTPSYFISTKLDHIAKWESCYLGARHHGGDVRFVLGESGHIAGIINSPEKNKYGHWLNQIDSLNMAPKEWVKNAKKVEGSWWLDWAKWMQERNNQQVAARIPEQGPNTVIEDAPGSYVKQRLSLM